MGAGARPGQTFLWIILLSDSEGKEERVSVLRLASDETVTLMRQTLHCTNRRYQMNGFLSHPVHKEMRRGFSRTCDLLTPKGICPESGRYSIFLVSFFFFNPYDRVPGCFNGFSVLVSTSPIPVLYNRSGRSEVDKNERTVCFGLQASVSFVLLLSYSCDARFFWWDHH